MKSKQAQGVAVRPRKRTAGTRFLRAFAISTLQRIFDQRIFQKDNAGVDGVHAHDLDQEASFEVIERKVRAGTYHFAPYAEIQLSKGRGKPPRILALPTVRDQTVLSALKDYLLKLTDLGIYDCGKP